MATQGQRLIEMLKRSCSKKQLLWANLDGPNAVALAWHGQLPDELTTFFRERGLPNSWYIGGYQKQEDGDYLITFKKLKEHD